MDATMLRQMLQQITDDIARPNRHAEDALLRLLALAPMLDATPPTDWPALVTQWAEAPMAHALPACSKASDPYALLYALSVLVARGPANKPARLMETMTTMEAALDCAIVWETRDMRQGPGAAHAYPRLQERWRRAAPDMAPVLQRWLQMQLANLHYPLGGFRGVRMVAMTTILAVRFATVRLALMCHVRDDGTPPDLTTMIRVIQSLSRLMDHLADGELSLLLYRDAGWLSDAARLRGLITI
jgi:hypothetical protein